MSGPVYRFVRKATKEWGTGKCGRLASSASEHTYENSADIALILQKIKLKTTNRSTTQSTVQ